MACGPAGLRVWEGWSWVLRLDPVLCGRVEGKDPIEKELGHGTANLANCELL